MIINEVNLMRSLEKLQNARIIAIKDDSMSRVDLIDELVEVTNFALKALKLEQVSQGLVNKCNVVTAYWRHNSQELIDEEMMDEMYHRQLETEAALQEYRNGQK